MLAQDAKILVVDDMKMVRTSIKRFLNSLGYENVYEAVDGSDALEQHAMVEPDFIFMDIVMPNLNGNEALKKIRENDVNVPVVMLTSVSDETLINECQEQGVTGYILKPLTKDKGPETLSSMLAKV
jgi:DNA-binding NarL/FixJ family response regulator